MTYLINNPIFSQKALYLCGEYTPNEYYKDIDNDLNKFIGTWQFTDGGLTTFKIILKKKTNYYDSYFQCYTDILVGEYQYIEEGIEQCNTLSLIDTRLNADDNTISGNSLFRCDTCIPGQRDKVHLTLTDPRVTGFGHVLQMDVKYYIENGLPKLKVALYNNDVLPDTMVSNYPPNYLVVRKGKYIMTKL